MTPKEEVSNGEAPTIGEDLPPTDMLYMTYEGNWLTECEASVLRVEKQEEKVSFTLDRTVMHAQGGGQPTDKGVFKVGDETILQVEKVTIDRSTGIATHAGKLTVPDRCVEVGEKVQVNVDKEVRQILSECHTAGHVVDSAMAKCGKFLKPSKAYHFLEGPYVEYEGSLEADEKTSLLGKLQEAFYELVEEDHPTKIETMSMKEADEVCNRQAQNFDMDIFKDPRTNQIRVVTVAGFPCPCGGTHVRSTAALRDRQWGITKIQSKKGVLRVKYGQHTKK